MERLGSTRTPVGHDRLPRRDAGVAVGLLSRTRQPATASAKPPDCHKPIRRPRPVWGVRHEHSLEILTGANVHPVRLIGLSLPETRSMHLPQRFAMSRSNRRMGRHLHRAFDRQWNPDLTSRTRIDD